MRLTIGFGYGRSAEKRTLEGSCESLRMQLFLAYPFLRDSICSGLPLFGVLDYMASATCFPVLNLDKELMQLYEADLARQDEIDEDEDEEE